MYKMGQTDHCHKFPPFAQLLVPLSSREKRHGRSRRPLGQMDARQNKGRSLLGGADLGWTKGQTRGTGRKQSGRACKRYVQELEEDEWGGDVGAVFSGTRMIQMIVVDQQHGLMSAFGIYHEMQ
jgi:hypothetical protein